MASFTIRGLTPDGHAPQTLRDEIRGMIQAAKPAPVTVEAEQIAARLGFWPVRSGTKPPATMYDVPVVWFDTSTPAAPAPVTPAPSTPTLKKVTPQAPTFSGGTRTYTIPTVEGVIYQAGGQTVTGTVSVTAPASVTITAKPAEGYTFPVGAVASWTFAFEAQGIPYEDIVLPMSSYMRFDDEASATTARDRGTAPLSFLANNGYRAGKFSPGGPGIGVGASSAVAKGNDQLVFNFNPSEVKSFTSIVVTKVNRADNQSMGLMGLWSNGMPTLFMLNQKGEGGRTIVNFQNTGSARMTEVAPVSNLADGEIVVLASIWDGTTIHGYVNGREVASIPWAGSQSTNDFLKGVSWGAGGQTMPIAGFGFARNVVKDADWVRRAYEAVKQSAGAA